jgi:hypothetical protein
MEKDLKDNCHYRCSGCPCFWLGEIPLYLRGHAVQLKPLTALLQNTMEPFPRVQSGHRDNRNILQLLTLFSIVCAGGANKGKLL